MSRSLAKSGKATAMKSLNEKWLSIVQSAREKGENGTGGSSTVTLSFHLHPHSRPLVSPFVLVSTCSLILDHVLSVFFSHHRLLQSFFLIVLFYFSLTLIVYLLGEVDVITPILLIFSFAPYLPLVSLTFLWT